MKRILLFVSFCCLICKSASAQQTYALSTGGPLLEISGTGTPVSLDPSTSSPALPIGFNFEFWENSYSTFYINPNGTLSFENALLTKMSPGPYATQKLGGSPDIDNFIAFAWQVGNYDFTNSTINYFTTGSSPSRILVVNYKGVSVNQAATDPYPNTGQGTIDVQIQLFEGATGKIQIHSTNNKTFGGIGSDSGPGQVGVENKSGSLFKEASSYAVVYANVPFAGYIPTPRYYYDFSGEMVEFRKCMPPSTPLISASNSTICASRPAVTLTASGANGAQYVWATGQTGPEISVTSEGNYRAKAVVDGCESVYSANAEIHALTSTPTITSNITSVNCNQTSATLTSSYMGAGTYTWTNGTDVLQNTSAYQYQTQGQQFTTDYYVTFSLDGCSSPVSNKFTISGGCVSPPIITAVTAPPYCSGSSITLQAAGCPSPGVVTWTGGDTGENFTTQELSAAESDNNYGGYKSYNYSATCTVNGVTSSAASWSGTVYYVPQLPTTITGAPSSPVSPGTAITLTANYNGGVLPFVWTWNNGTNTSGSNPLTDTPQSTTQYSVVRSKNGCLSPAKSVTVSVNNVISISNSTPTVICGSRGTSVPVNFTNTGSFGSDFTVSLVQAKKDYGNSATSKTVKTVFVTNSPAELTVPDYIPATYNNTSAQEYIVYKIVVSNSGVTSADYPVLVTLPSVGNVTAVGAAAVTAPGQNIQLSSPASNGTNSKTWYSHSETQYWTDGTLIAGLTSDNITVTPQTSTYYSVVYKDNSTQCTNRSARIRIPFNLAVSGTGSAADLIYAEGRGVHLDASGTVGGNQGGAVIARSPQYYIPSGSDEGTQVYSTVFDNGYPTEWTGYFIIRANNYWEIHRGWRPMYSYVRYERIYHTKNAFPTASTGGRSSGRAAAEITGTRPPESAVWIKDADNSELSLTLAGVSENYGALPVTLTYFNAKRNGNKQVEIKWETTSEQNSDYFEVERSADLKSFAVIAKVKAKNNYQGKTVYQVTDENPVRGMNYYRLKQADRDGTSQYYRMVMVRTEGTDAPYPNPSNGRYLNLDIPVTATIILTNTKGEAIPFERKKLSETTIQLLPKTILSPGLYVVTINGLSRKLVVQ